MHEPVYNCQVKNLNKIYEETFGGNCKGFFVEVGAYNGYDFSNVWGLAQDGWRGICLEPVPEFYELCKQTYQGLPVETLCLAAGMFNGKITFYKAGTLSTYNVHQLKSETWKNDYKGKQQIYVDVDTLDHIFEVHNVPSIFEVLSIDTEGSEVDVLGGLDLEKWQPTLIIIELHEGHYELGGDAKSVTDYLACLNYEKIYSDEINNIYRKKK